MMKLLFWLCWAAYFTSYLGRLNYSSVMPVMIKKALIDSSQAGIISMTYFFAYGVGQFFNGLLGDKFRPQRMIFAGLFIAGLSNIGMSFAFSYHYMAVVWAINGYAQSMIWPPIIRIFAEMLIEAKRVKYCVDITSSQVLGALGAYVLSALFLLLSGWKSVFVMAAVLLIAMALIWRFGFGRLLATSRDTTVREREMHHKKAILHGKKGTLTLKTANHDEKTDSMDSGEETENTYSNGKKEVVHSGMGMTGSGRGMDTAGSDQGQERTGAHSGLLGLLAANGLLFFILPDAIHGMLKDGVTSWIPTYITEVFHTSPSLAVVVTTVLPVVNLAGAYAAAFVYKRTKKSEVRSAGVFFLVAVCALLGIRLAGRMSLIVTILLFAIITSSMMAINTVFVSLLPLRFEKLGKVSTISGFMNSVAYLGTAVSTFTIGIMVEHFGWTLTLVSWIVITGAAFLICVLLTLGDNKKAVHSRKEAPHGGV